ncbi:S-adenosyl-L-methionine-dependent methyltransferase [Jimgerdemannia flammicorona]|uniref:S-adenosyl-L-methionine-dependent methyltransferase n=1 Tax=Jimgerdemannia flammicorona TaxID=994334 RepID=A0A433D2I2_9FUNG|nr:S-adenosyl-L-methionine-dependent methyltransferase [Jimgerdemannia flammicorona]
MPNTVEEAQRLSALGELLKGALENNYLPPINVKLLGDAKVLDVGLPTEPALEQWLTLILLPSCGPETWATELARKYPSSRVTAIDLVETAGPRPDRPPNYQFLIADALQPLPFPDNTFDFVHMRLMSHAFSAADWKPVLKELKRVMKPGGWIQMIEADQRMYYISGAGVEGKKTMDKVIHTLAARGQLTDVANVLDKLLRKSGYADITTNYVSIPVGKLPSTLLLPLQKKSSHLIPFRSLSHPQAAGAADLAIASRATSASGSPILSPGSAISSASTPTSTITWLTASLTSATAQVLTSIITTSSAQSLLCLS